MTDLTLGLMIDASSGALLLGLAAFVASLRPRTRASLALAAYSALSGLLYLVTNLTAPGQFATKPGLVGLVLATLTGLATLALAAAFPDPLARAERRLLLPAAVFAAGFSAVIFVFVFPGLGADAIGASIIILLYGSAGAAITLWAMRAAAQPGRVPRFALMSAGLAVGFDVSSGTGVGGTALGLPPELRMPLVLAVFALLALPAALWLLAAARASDARERRVAQRMAWLGLAAFGLGLLLTPLLGPSPSDSGVNGASRALGVGILAYAILRHQILGIDTKLRWTIQRGTLAGIFLAVFFVVSQLAQNVLNAQLGTLTGAIAAGLLLFALAPLQRVAERVSDAALPNVRAQGELGRDERARVYARAVGLAWADGRMTPKERRLLRGLREELRLPADEAERIEHEGLPSPAEP